MSTATATATPAKRVRQSEAEVIADVLRFLKSEGWFWKRNQVQVGTTKDGRTLRTGTVGDPDYTFMRAIKGAAGLVHLFYLETKKNDDKLKRKVQRERAADLRHLGFLVTWADSLEMLQQWYRKQGF